MRKVKLIATIMSLTMALGLMGFATYAAVTVEDPTAVGGSVTVNSTVAITASIHSDASGTDGNDNISFTMGSSTTATIYVKFVIDEPTYAQGKAISLSTISFTGAGLSCKAGGSTGTTITTDTAYTTFASSTDGTFASTLEFEITLVNAADVTGNYSLTFDFADPT